MTVRFPATPVRLWSLAALAACAGCVTYEPSPLDLRASLEAEQEVRHAAPTLDAPDLALATVTAWMAEHGPGVRTARAAWEAARARAAVPTPWADPSLQFGPQVAWGSDVGSSRAVTPFASLSIAIPLGERLEAQDAQNLALAEVARIETVLRLREEYLAVRSAWAELASARVRSLQLAAWAELAQESVALSQRQIELGLATALDKGLLQLDRARVEVQALDAALDANRAIGDLAARTGMPLERFDALGASSLPALPDQVPAVDGLRELLGAHRPDLIRLRAKHALAERNLRLQIARQYPDLQLGPVYTAEAGEQRDQLGLGLGIRVPWFDANRQAIAAAAGERDQTRATYSAGLQAALAELDSCMRALALTRARRIALEERILPEAEANVALARRQTQAGAVDTLRILDAQRSVQELRVAATTARLDELASWLALERAVGHPIVPFPGEPASTGLPSPSAQDAESLDPHTRLEVMAEAQPRSEEASR
jgi:cobalt-zinc-cadmium efflux system outer membrane protein